MIVILGESASGKDTLANALVKHDPKKYRKLVLFTTRPRRDGEENGFDYRFVTELAFEEFRKRNFFAHTACYNNWYYGIPACELKGNTDGLVAVLTPAAMRDLKKQGVQFTSVYLYVDRPSRIVAMIDQRGDGVDEAYRRSLFDAGQFDGVENEVDFIIDNPKYQMSMEQALDCLLNALEDKPLNGEPTEDDAK